MSIPTSPGPIIELGPGTGPVTEALVEQGIDPARLVLVEFDPDSAGCCRRAIRPRPWCRAMPTACGACWRACSREPAAAVVSGLPLFTKPLQHAAAASLRGVRPDVPGAPFVQFTYAAVSPIPKRLDRVRAEASERDLDEHAAGAGVGLSKGLTAGRRRRGIAEFRLIRST